MTPLTLPAPAKLNLCLKIIGRRKDGYHLLQTVFQLLDFGDTLQFAPANELVLHDTSDIPGEDNLVLRAARLLAAHTQKQAGAHITLQKRVPMGAGLGGGSSDAATTLVGLNHLWQLGLGIAELTQLGIKLGADVPVFINGYSAWAEGVGERLTKLKLPEKYFLVIYPACHVNTGQVFGHAELTRDSSAITIARFLESGAGNDCENVVRKLYPEVDAALLWLMKWGAAKMTGTGSSVFLDFDSREAAEVVKAEVPENWQSFVAKAENVSALRGALVYPE